VGHINTDETVARRVLDEATPQGKVFFSQVVMIAQNKESTPFRNTILRV
jgi:hypothetical protein